MAPPAPASPEEPGPPPAIGERVDTPTEADVAWALSKPVTEPKRAFLRAATQKVTMEQDRADARAARLEAWSKAIESMWPQRPPRDGEAP